MTTSNTLSNIQASLIRFCMDFIVTHPDMIFVNYDAHADETTVPPGDLIGPSGLSLTFDEQLIDINLMFGVATDIDTNLFRLNNLMGQLLELLKPTKKIRVLDSESGVELGWMVVQNGTRLLPIGGSKVKPLQYIMVRLGTSETFKSSE